MKKLPCVFYLTHGKENSSPCAPEPMHGKGQNCPPHCGPLANSTGRRIASDGQQSTLPPWYKIKPPLIQTLPLSLLLLQPLPVLAPPRASPPPVRSPPRSRRAPRASPPPTPPPSSRRLVVAAGLAPAVRLRSPTPTGASPRPRPLRCPPPLPSRHPRPRHAPHRPPPPPSTGASASTSTSTGRRGTTRTRSRCGSSPSSWSRCPRPTTSSPSPTTVRRVLSPFRSGGDHLPPGDDEVVARRAASFPLHRRRCGRLSCRGPPSPSSPAAGSGTTLMLYDSIISCCKLAVIQHRIKENSPLHCSGNHEWFSNG
jgi:hypothetical protein